MSVSASSWWESRSPEKQRAHIKRHPNGKYAKMVKNRQLALKPISNNGAAKKAKFRKPVGGNVGGNVAGDAGDEESEEEDSEEEEEDSSEDAAADEDDSEKEPAEDEEKKDADFEDEPAGLPAPRQTRPIPPRAAMANAYRSSLPDALKAGLRAFFGTLDSGRSPGTRADLSTAKEEMNRGDIPAVVKKMKPKSREDESTLTSAIKATLPIAKVVALGLIGVGAAAAGAGMVPALLACYFINSTLNADSLSRSAVYASLSGDECDRLVETFMDWAEGLDLDTIAESANSREFTSTSSTGVEVKIRRCPLDYYRGLEEACGRRYLLVVGNKVRGFLKWDKKYGEPSKEANGWYSVLVDGFNENAYRSDRDAATLEPYTTVYRNDIVLVNPARMPYDFARQWAVSVLRR